MWRRFVTQKLATIQGVISTATHFMLKVYKEHGMLISEDHNEERLAVAPEWKACRRFGLFR